MDSPTGARILPLLSEARANANRLILLVFSCAAATRARQKLPGRQGFQPILTAKAHV
jgi:hypothetical protein